MHNLEYIEMRDCVDIDDRGVAALISGCKSLKYIGVNNCPYVVDFEAIDKINERGEWEDVDEYVSDDMSGEFSDEYSEGLYDEYSDEFYEDYHGGVNGGYHGEFYDSDFEDDYDNGIF
ncbi:hypothetical protein FBU59_005156 [Linderina macrospora]|uniref:Uncharacterized protein n=1 Tax=Linderina macrospora TaxID=4868 RepID=A0ACC1J3R8_9FUNG|nr:hypothetical protein FBU59_005156 [Linderina macrospora]